MAKLFSTKTHGVLDYLTVGTLLTLPRALGWNTRPTALLTNAALMTLGYSLATRYELGLLKLLPMRAHLALDAMSAVGLLAAPWLLPDEDSSVKATLIGLGLFELTVTLSTEAEPSYEEDVIAYIEDLQHRTQDTGEGLQERTAGA